MIRIGLRRCHPGRGSSILPIKYSPVPMNLNFLSCPYLIVEGVATSAYMPERSTLDLDILIRSADRDIIHAELRGEGAIYRQELSISGSSWTLKGQPLDVLESSGDWVEEAFLYPNWQNGDPVMALPYLVLMKMKAGRGIDIGDITRMLGRTENLSVVREVIKRYMPDATEDLESLIILGSLENQ